MKKSKIYLILIIIDIILLIAWPICLIGWSAPGWFCFLTGVVWCIDFQEEDENDLDYSGIVGDSTR